MAAKELSGHLALVTGASGGIGRATCIALAKLGCNVAVHYHSSEKKAREVETELTQMGVKANVFKADLSRYSEVCKILNSLLLNRVPC
jgi:3-oxoacyl-[acyl-carrier protein] reductase